MESRRDFLKKAALLTGGATMWNALPESIARAIEIDPEMGSTFMDAEHIVILMQENRSFDHSYGTLQGVRGYNDPRAHTLANGNPVWCQTNADGETYAPFRLDINRTKITWMGSLPHNWTDQVDARNNGAYDRWLQVKGSGGKAYSKMPLTLGHYTREDIPFYYALADAFTICDQHFCSSLTGTTPNRLHLWTGTVRGEPKLTSKPVVLNSEADNDTEVGWTTFPERLEQAGISWKIYQNELYQNSGFKGEEEGWLSNFGDNPIEYFTQFSAKLSPTYRAHLKEQLASQAIIVDALETEAALSTPTDDQRKKLGAATKKLDELRAQAAVWNDDAWKNLPNYKKALHEKAFTDNRNDPNYRELEEITYSENGNERKLKVPKGDLFHQFRADVDAGSLPTVSWLVAPENFSDHPSSAWYGAWYVAEAMDILTKNPEVWKKTIFILTYDENDGYFDHVPPFVAPNPKDAETGKCSEGIDTSLEFVTMEQDKLWRGRSARESSIGLGYRVPMVIASPWSRRGTVCSEVFDHTSVLQFLEVFLSSKTGKPIVEENISRWRRTICGDLTSSFQDYDGKPPIFPKRPTRDEFVAQIHSSKFKDVPKDFQPLTLEQIESIRQRKRGMSAQEKGTRRSAPLPYELAVEAAVADDAAHFVMELSAGEDRFGPKATGCPFNAYSYGPNGKFQARSYAVEAGKSVSDEWPISGNYHFRVDGPNGFMREYIGSARHPRLLSKLVPARKGHKARLELRNASGEQMKVTVTDRSYGDKVLAASIAPGGGKHFVLDFGKRGGWYDFAITVDGSATDVRYAGRLETGEWSISDPAMG